MLAQVVEDVRCRSDWIGSQEQRQAGLLTGSDEAHRSRFITHDAAVGAGFQIGGIDRITACEYLCGISEVDACLQGLDIGL